MAFDKFTYADRSLGTQMKATGEVVSIDRTIEGSIMKAIRSLEIRVDGPSMKEINEMPLEVLVEYLKLVDDRRLFVIFELLRREYPIGKIARDTMIDIFFLKKFENIIKYEKNAKKLLTKEIVLSKERPTDEIVGFLKEIKQIGFGDTYLARLVGVKHMEFREFRKSCNILPVYKMVDTCAAEFERYTILLLHIRVRRRSYSK